MIPIFTPLIAVLLPMFVMWRSYHDRPLKKAYLYSVSSFTAALAAVCTEVRTIGIRAASGDFAGIEDTMQAVLIICVGITLVTAVLNLLALASAYSE